MASKSAVKSTDSLAILASRYWRGEEPLWAQFWIYGMVVGTIIGTANTFFMDFFLNSLYVAMARGSVFEMLLLVWPVMTLLGFWVTYYTWHVVSVWRCARNASHPAIGWLARIFVLLVTATYWPILILWAIES